MARGLYVMGLERGAGCTTVCRALVRALRERGDDAVALKPVAVGCPLRSGVSGPVSVGGLPGEADTQALAALSRLAEVAGPPPSSLAGDTPPEALDCPEARLLARASGDTVDAEQINLYRFAPDIEPGAAARAAGVRIDLPRIAALVENQAQHGELVVVDGGVGPMTPLDEQHTTLDLLQRLQLPVALVAPSRPWGAINPTLMAYQLLGGRELVVNGVVLNRTDQLLRSEEAVNPYQIEQFGGQVRGLLPFLESGQLADDEQLARRLEMHVDVDGLLGR
jgi:dethiobiotin synthetase